MHLAVRLQKNPPSLCSCKGFTVRAVLTDFILPTQQEAQYSTRDSGTRQLSASSGNTGYKEPIRDRHELGAGFHDEASWST
ncbi:hypothetical protein CDEST_11114 [Colletotrichum destructivum]|uniref:Uncharacterized protein n=1 Tax=Colletotrichum destructivum TaxID=34406 RepID=A0AAX4ISG8_9PEZI|nr:hypothetical protein CDEST_11114 [Colletotrichum destructivum]